MACCGCGAITWTVIFMIYNIIQCLFHLFIHIIFLSINLCVAVLSDSDQQQIFYLTYFNTENCGETFKNNGPSETTKSLAISYLVFDIFWIVFSAIILCLVCAPNKNKITLALYLTWDTISGVELMLDVFAIIMYSLDVGKTQNLIDWAQFVGTDKSKFNFDNSITQLPSILMTIISARFIMFILLNILSFIGMILITIKIWKNLNVKNNKRVVPLKPPKPVIKIPKTTHIEDENKPRVNDWYKHYEEVKEEEEEVPQYFPRVSEKLRANSPDSNFSEANNHGNILNNTTNVMVNGVTSGTLRRQLPWSYVAHPGDIVKNQPRRWNVEAPPVPVPDYSLSLPRNKCLKVEDRLWEQYPTPSPKLRRY